MQTRPCHCQARKSLQFFGLVLSPGVTHATTGSRQSPCNSSVRKWTPPPEYTLQTLFGPFRKQALSAWPQNT